MNSIYDNRNYFCTKCGKRIDQSAKYCSYCGKRQKRLKSPLPFRKIIVIFCLIFVIVIVSSFAGYSIVNYKNGTKAIDNQQFFSAQMYFERIPFYEKLFPRESEYIKAGIEVGNLIERGKYIDALAVFENTNYPVPASVTENLKDTIYQVAKKYYNSESYLQARAIFEALGNYERSEDYAILARCQGGAYAHLYDEIYELIGFEDAGEIIIKHPAFGKCFLEGRWETEDGSYYFNMDEQYSTSYNLPHKYISDNTYILSNGLFVEYDNHLNLVDQFRIKVIDQNTITVYCFKNNKTYKMYRQ